MRTVAKLVSLGLVVIAVGCSRDEGRRESALTSDLQRDLQLATSTVALAQPTHASNFALETAPSSDPEPQITLRRGPGRRAIRSREHTVAASPESMAAESIDQTLAVAETEARATESDAPVSEGVPLPRPTAIPVSLPTEGQGTVIVQGDGRGEGRGPGIGTIIGVVIRGGGVGEDHCEIHDGRRRDRRRPVYTGNPGGIAGGRTPMIGRGTFPVSY